MPPSQKSAEPASTSVSLSVNLNKVALLRNSRGASAPSPLRAAEACIDGGVQGITLHWRQDNRHTLRQDVLDLCALCKERGVEFNLEGDARPELVDLALQIKPTQFTLVPVTPGEVTSDHGWDLPRECATIKPIIQRANDAGIRSAIFMDALPVGAQDADPRHKALEEAVATETQRIEIYTEPYAAAFGSEGESEAFNALKTTIAQAKQLGLGVNAGHDLNLRNMPKLVRECPGLLEVSIGHALIADALYLGLDETIRRYLQVCQGDNVAVPRTDVDHSAAKDPS